MLIPLLATVGIAAVTAWLSFLAVRYLLPRLPSLAALQQARRDRIARDPSDYVRAWVARIAPSRLRLEQQTAAAERNLKRARKREKRILTAFKDGKAPTLRFTITVVSLSAVWLVAVAAAFFLDLPIINSVSGGNAFYGILGALLILGVPIIGSVLLGHFFLNWRAGKLSEVLFSLAATLILAAVAMVVVLLTVLAPIRAEVEYADKLRTAEQQKAMYEEKGDQNALRFAEQNLTGLQGQQRRSAEWNTALVPTASAAEFATGFFVPLAIPILMLGEARTSRRKAQRILDTAQDRVNNQRALQYRRISRAFQRAGLTQAELQRHFAAVAAENRPGPGSPAIDRARAAVAEELREQAAEAPDAENRTAPGPADQLGAAAAASTAGRGASTTPPGAAAEPLGPHRPGPPGPGSDLPDESFDLS